MKVAIPDALKSDVPANLFGKILAATPVVMTVIATMLAGLSTSEMTRAQYDRSLAAQLQSKAGDQWSYFQAKRLRETVHDDTLELLKAQATVQAWPDSAGLGRRLDQLGADSAWRDSWRAWSDLPKSREALDCLRDGGVPSLGAKAAAGASQKIHDVIAALDDSLPESEVARRLRMVDDAELASALQAARDRAKDFDSLTKPVNRAIDALGRVLERLPASPEAAQLRRDFTAARLRYTAARYAAESAYNQAIGSLLELQVRKSNLSAERHHARSQRFFMGMLGAQLAVIVATFAMAARQKNILWGIAAFAGIGALILSVYVYLYV